MDDGDPPTAPTLEARRLSELGLHAAVLVHELRQPLFALKAIAQLGAADPSSAVTRLGAILEQVETMEALLHGYHDFSRSPTGRDEVFDVWASLRSALIILEHRAAAAGVPLRVGPARPIGVRGSMLAVQQVVVNLGQNALDAVAGRPGAEVHIACDTAGERVRIVVSDTGPGLPDAILERLFEPFHTTKPGGTGLGLSLSRDLILACGGELRLVPGPSTCWEILLRGVGAPG